MMAAVRRSDGSDGMGTPEGALMALQEYYPQGGPPVRASGAAGAYSGVSVS